MDYLSVGIDPNKTTIYIGNYYGGLGDKWLDVLTTQYEATHPDVQFKIENDKTPYLLDNIKNNISSSKCSLFFVEKIYYYDMVNQGSLADISDVVTSSWSEYGETGTIEDKLEVAKTKQSEIPAIGPAPKYPAIGPAKKNEDLEM